MVAYEGIAVMYLNMPMCAQPLPIFGSCEVVDKKISLKFPLTNISFDMASAPQDGKDVDFKVAGPKGDMALKIAYKSDMRAFVGQGQQDGANVITFSFAKVGQGFQHFKQL